MYTNISIILACYVVERCIQCMYLAHINKAGIEIVTSNGSSLTRDVYVAVRICMYIYIYIYIDEQIYYIH